MNTNMGITCVECGASLGDVTEIIHQNWGKEIRVDVKEPCECMYSGGEYPLSLEEITEQRNEYYTLLCNIKDLTNQDCTGFNNEVLDMIRAELDLVELQ